MKILLKIVSFSFRWSDGGTRNVNWSTRLDNKWNVSVTGYVRTYITNTKPNQTNSIRIAKEIITKSNQ